MLNFGGVYHAGHDGITTNVIEGLSIFDHETFQAILNPQDMGEMTPKNGGSLPVGSHGWG